MVATIDRVAAQDIVVDPEAPIRGRQRRAARYLDVLATSTAKRTEPLDGLSPAEIMQALIATFGEGRARQIAHELVTAAAQLVEIARTFKGRAA